MENRIQQLQRTKTLSMLAQVCIGYLYTNKIYEKNR